MSWLIEHEFRPPLIDHEDAEMTWVAIVEGSEIFHALDPDIPRHNQDVWLSQVEKHRDCGVWLNGIVTVEQAQALIRKGWSEGAKQALKLTKWLSDIPLPRDIRRRPSWGDDGDEIDIHRVYDGRLDDAWRKMRRALMTADQVVTIATNWGGNANVDQNQMMWSDAAAIALADALESRGYRTELVAISEGTSCRSAGEVLIVKVKEASEPLRPGLFAAIMCHVAGFRWFGLALTARSPAKITSDFGRSHHCIEQAVVELYQREIIDRVDVVLPSVFSPESAGKALEEILQHWNEGVR